MNRSLKKVILWLAVLPGSTIAAITALFFLHLFLERTLSNFIPKYPELLERVFTPFVFMFTFVWSGYQIAPNNKNKTAIFLFAMCIFLSGGLIVSSLTGGKLFDEEIYLEANGFATVMGMVGAFWALFTVIGKKNIEESNNSYNDDKNLNRQKVEGVKNRKISFVKKYHSELLNLMFSILFSFCVFIENVRFVFFIIILIIVGLGILIDLVLMDKNGITKSKRIEIVKNLIYFSLIGVGVYGSIIGYYVSILFCIIHFYYLFRSFSNRNYFKQSE